MENNQKGSILLWILVAVVLLAGLTTAINQGSRTSTGMMSSQQAKLAATEIVQYGANLKQAVNRLQLSGCSENGLDFFNSVWARGDGTQEFMPDHNEHASPECHVLESGGAQAVLFPANYFEKITPGASQIKIGAGSIMTARFPGVGTEDASDLYYYLPRIDAKICAGINDLVGVKNINGEPPPHIITGWTKYNSQFSNNTVTDTSGEISGKTVMCTLDSGTNTYSFYQILIAR